MIFNDKNDNEYVEIDGNSESESNEENVSGKVLACIFRRY